MSERTGLLPWKIHSTREAARKLGLSQDHVKLLARTQVIPALKLGRDWIILSLDYKRKRKPKKSKPSGGNQK